MTLASTTRARCEYTGATSGFNGSRFLNISHVGDGGSSPANLYNGATSGPLVAPPPNGKLTADGSVTQGNSFDRYWNAAPPVMQINAFVWCRFNGPTLPGRFDDIDIAVRSAGGHLIRFTGNQRWTAATLDSGVVAVSVTGVNKSGALYSPVVAHAVPQRPEIDYAVLTFNLEVL